MTTKKPIEKENTKQICSHPPAVTGATIEAVVNMFVELEVISMRAVMSTDVSTVVMIGFGVCTLVNIETIVVTAVVSGFGVIVEVVFAVEALAGAIIGGAPGIDAGVNAYVLKAVMSALDFAEPSPLEK